MPRKTCKSSSCGLSITEVHSHKIFSRTAKEKSAQFKLLETCVFQANALYYMAGSASGQDEVNPVF